MCSITINGNRLDLPAQAPSLQLQNNQPGLHNLGEQAEDASNSNYILVQTKGKPLKGPEKQELLNLGVNIEEYVGENTYLCGYKPTDLNVIRSLDYVNYANVYQPSCVVEAELKEAEAETKLSVEVILHDDVEDDDDLRGQLAKAAHVEVDAVTIAHGRAHLEVAKEQLNGLAAVDAVRYINSSPEPRLFNDVARSILKADVVINDTPYKGEGQIVAVADSGFDIGEKAGCHYAFEGRVKELHDRGRPGLTNDITGHGTHVCGSVLGVGDSPENGGLIEAPASAATLVMQSIFSGWVVVNGGRVARLEGIRAYENLFQEAYDDGARIHTNSYGSGPGAYEGGAADAIDQFLWDHKDMVVLFAAGNGGVDVDGSGGIDLGSISREASAKNCIAVGASENHRPNIKRPQARPYTWGDLHRVKFPSSPIKNDHMANDPDGMAAFSSRGPTRNGRYKPDVVAPGTAILSARSSVVDHSDDQFWGVSDDPRWWYSAGTSMACPLVAGCCAVLRETLVKNGVKKPSAALIKALLLNGAVDIPGQYTPKEDGPSPNNNSGFGRVNLQDSVIIPEAKNAGFSEGARPLLDDEEFNFSISVPSANSAGQSSKLKVTLVWTDPPGAKLQNDLDLTVTAPEGTERHGNMGEMPGFDRVNNVEQVAWSGVLAGQYSIKVRAERIVRHQQPFAVAWRVY
ncbi:hypothetical protein W97_09349 [Coniosporium apollinis CBS 100218]|uniref:Peptidase S8/S53 domain-containing protein n=1 Tax=Coniosporium apollinis (strain CBS 100218) TaxID=1168221 RepID=R7Z7K5_CONA1|nr:uncharacterized protein W97_09349 [Coniosporium apollinis CBS 100218]EON70083.1 hypothetical protein W97_09349 [Coniosporium apollinis CBS 100218]